MRPSGCIVSPLHALMTHEGSGETLFESGYVIAHLIHFRAIIPSSVCMVRGRDLFVRLRLLGHQILRLCGSITLAPQSLLDFTIC